MSAAMDGSCGEKSDPSRARLSRLPYVPGPVNLTTNPDLMVSSGFSGAILLTRQAPPVPPAGNLTIFFAIPL